MPILPLVQILNVKPFRLQCVIPQSSMVDCHHLHSNAACPYVFDYSH